MHIVDSWGEGVASKHSFANKRPVQMVSQWHVQDSGLVLWRMVALRSEVSEWVESGGLMICLVFSLWRHGNSGGIDWQRQWARW